MDDSGLWFNDKGAAGLVFAWINSAIAGHDN